MLGRLAWGPDLARPVDGVEASELSGVRLARGGLYFPRARQVAPDDCAPLDGIDAVADLWRPGAGDFDAVVIAAGPWSGTLLPGADLPLTANRGQLSFLPPTRASRRLRLPIGFGGHLTPAQHFADGPVHVLGSSYDRWEVTEDWRPLRSEDREGPLTKLAGFAPGLTDGWRGAPMHGWAGLRAVTPDHLPLVGRVSSGSGNTPVYMVSGLGSRGYQTAFLAADLLAAQIAGAPLPVPGFVADALRPDRFAKKNARD